MHFEAHLKGAPTVLQQASPGQARHERRPGYRIQKGQSPEGARQVAPPLQGFVRDGRLTQGVALGWYVAGPLALNAARLFKNQPTQLFPIT
jgi:hypothetical protein